VNYTVQDCMAGYWAYDISEIGTQLSSCHGQNTRLKLFVSLRSVIEYVNLSRNNSRCDWDGRDRARLRSIVDAAVLRMIPPLLLLLLPFGTEVLRWRANTSTQSVCSLLAHVTEINNVYHATRQKTCFLSPPFLPLTPQPTPKTTPLEPTSHSTFTIFIL